MPSYLKPLQQRNKHKINPRQWKKWPDIAQRVFNEVYSDMVLNQHLFLHPKADAHAKEHWNTTAHNAAWTAADAVVKALDDIIAGKGYARKK